jgi:hypothetical protein
MFGRAIHVVERQRDETCEPGACELNNGQRNGSQSGGHRCRMTRGVCRTVSPYQPKDRLNAHPPAYQAA